MRKRVFLRYVLWIWAGMTVLSACKTVRELPMVEARSISTTRLIKKIEQHSFDYNYFTVKRINCSFTSSKSNANFKVSLKAQKDSAILISISKINIPVGRVLLTPDSVKYVNYIDKNFFVGDYSFISDFLNMEVNFATVQSIISNQAFSYRSTTGNKDFKSFDSFVEDGYYVLQSEKLRKLVKYQTKGKLSKLERKVKRFDQEALILQKLYFYPDNFALTRVDIEDKTNHRNIRMLFNNFEQINGYDYPGLIRLSFNSEEENIQLNVRMNGFSTEKTGGFEIKIPSRYKEIEIEN